MIVPPRLLVEIPVPRHRPGLTLLEVMVVLALLAIAAAVTAPALVMPRDNTSSVGQVVRGARGAAVARAEALSLALDAQGGWVLSRGVDSSVLARGRVEPALGVPMQFAFTPSGGCLPLTSPPALGSWDAARCLPLGAAQ